MLNSDDLRIQKLEVALASFVYDNSTNPLMTKGRAKEILEEWASWTDKQNKKYMTRELDKDEIVFSKAIQAILYQADQISELKYQNL